MSEQWIMEQILMTLVNEMDDSIRKYIVSEKMDTICLSMADGSEYMIQCREKRQEGMGR